MSILLSSVHSFKFAKQFYTHTYTHTFVNNQLYGCIVIWSTDNTPMTAHLNLIMYNNFNKCVY